MVRGAGTPLGDAAAGEGGEGVIEGPRGRQEIPTINNTYIIDNVIYGLKAWDGLGVRRRGCVGGCGYMGVGRWVQ